MKKILVVEDDSFISVLLCELLRQNGYVPVAAYSGTEALFALQQDDYVLVLLDLMLPGKTGEEVLAEIRSTLSVPVIVLTARTDKETTVELLQLGADDYIAKPFDNSELLARMEVQLRRSLLEQPHKHQTAKQVRHRDIILNLDDYDAHIKGKKAHLTKREFEILHLLMSRPRKVFSKNSLYEQVWGEDFFGDDNTLNVHISKLRAKLGALSPDTEYIQTVWGIGFRMKE